MTPTHRAVIMARGLGTRMRRAAGVPLTPEQASVARDGVKALIPIGGRPFLDYVISGLADAGFDEVCLVTGPEHDDLRRRYTTEARPSRVAMSFVIQEQPRGTADAVLAARAFAEATPARPDLFLVVNSDNYYPTDVLRDLRRLGRPALAGFDADALVREGNFDRNRIAGFALLRTTQEDELREIVEKPDPATIDTMGSGVRVSMNCWIFGASIFAACAAIEPSSRGEFELADAVSLAMARGERFAVLPVSAGVLDLTSRADIDEVGRRLRDVAVRL